VESRPGSEVPEPAQRELAALGTRRFTSAGTSSGLVARMLVAIRGVCVQERSARSQADPSGRQAVSASGAEKVTAEARGAPRVVHEKK